MTMSDSNDKKKYTQQRKNDEAIVSKAYNKGTDPSAYGPQTQKAGTELTIIGNKIWQANHPMTMYPHTFQAGGGMTRTIHAPNRAAAKKKLGPPDIH